jgi:hypothetical protein
MPIALARSSLAARNRWFDDYVQLVLERDVRELSRLRQREQLPALLHRLAAQTVGGPEHHKGRPRGRPGPHHRRRLRKRPLPVAIRPPAGDVRRGGARKTGFDMHHLRKLRNALGDRFLVGIALYTGLKLA